MSAKSPEVLPAQTSGARINWYYARCPYRTDRATTDWLLGKRAGAACAAATIVTQLGGDAGTAAPVAGHLLPATRA